MHLSQPIPGSVAGGIKSERIFFARFLNKYLLIPHVIHFHLTKEVMVLSRTSDNSHRKGEIEVSQVRRIQKSNFLEVRL